MSRRQHLIETALRLFYEQGIHAVGINQVLAEAGVAKQTLYNHFESKDSLLEAAIEHRDKVFFQWFEQRVISKPLGREAALEVFDAMDDWINNRVPSLSHFCGCFFINACAEYSDPNHPVHQQCAKHKVKIMGLLQRIALALKGVKNDADQLADALYLLKEGAIVKAHVEGDNFAAIKARGVAELLI
jgi:AcrR family transcriptional regulator